MQRIPDGPVTINLPKPKRRGATTTSYQFFNDELPEHHILYCLDITFCITADVEPYVEARIYGDPDDCYPASGGTIEDLDATIEGPEPQDPVARAAIELAFNALIESDRKLRERIEEQLLGEAAEDLAEAKAWARLGYQD